MTTAATTTSPVATSLPTVDLPNMKDTEATATTHATTTTGGMDEAGVTHLIQKALEEQRENTDSRYHRSRPRPSHRYKPTKKGGREQSRCSKGHTCGGGETITIDMSGMRNNPTQPHHTRTPPRAWRQSGKHRQNTQCSIAPTITVNPGGYCCGEDWDDLPETRLSKAEHTVAWALAYSLSFLVDGVDSAIQAHRKATYKEIAKKTATNIAINVLGGAAMGLAYDWWTEGSGFKDGVSELGGLVASTAGTAWSGLSDYATRVWSDDW